MESRATVRQTISSRASPGNVDAPDHIVLPDGRGAKQERRDLGEECLLHTCAHTLRHHWKAGYYTDESVLPSFVQHTTST